jgi:flavodoxin short chain
MAEIIQKTLDQSGFQTDMKEVTSAAVDDLSADYDLVILGCPAYGDEEIELQEDFAEFYEQLQGLNLNKKQFAVFAPGDSSYEHFCGSVDMLEEKMEELGASRIADGLKVDGDPGDAERDIVEWAESVADAMG